MTMADSAFVDTNVLLRAMTPKLPLHLESEALIQRMWATNCDLWVSRQVIREYIVQATHPNLLSPQGAIDQVLRQLKLIASLFRVADDTADVTAHLLKLLETYPTRGKLIHDANIVATMRAQGIDTLLTLNTDDFKRFADVITLISPIGST